MRFDDNCGGAWLSQWDMRAKCGIHCRKYNNVGFILYSFGRLILSNLHDFVTGEYRSVKSCMVHKSLIQNEYVREAAANAA